MKKVKITVLRKEFYFDLEEKYLTNGKNVGECSLYQTPKIDSRAAIFQDNKILLVKEKDGTWSLPGGWV